jgi:hypothetical protein
VDHPRRDDLEPGLLETGIDLADDVLGHRVGLDDRKRALDSHETPLTE